MCPRCSAVSMAVPIAVSVPVRWESQKSLARSRMALGGTGASVWAGLGLAADWAATESGRQTRIIVYSCREPVFRNSKSATKTCSRAIVS